MEEVVTFTKMIKRKIFFQFCNTQSTCNEGSILVSSPSLYSHDSDMRKKAAKWRKNRILLAPECRYTCSQSCCVPSSHLERTNDNKTKCWHRTQNSKSRWKLRHAKKEDYTLKVSLLINDAHRGANFIMSSCALVLEVPCNGNRRLGLAISFLTAGRLKNTASLRMATRYAERKHLSIAALHAALKEHLVNKQ